MFLRNKFNATDPLSSVFTPFKLNDVFLNKNLLTLCTWAGYAHPGQLNYPRNLHDYINKHLSENIMLRVQQPSAKYTLKFL